MPGSFLYNCIKIYEWFFICSYKTLSVKNICSYKKTQPTENICSYKIVAADKLYIHIYEYVVK